MELKSKQNSFVTFSGSRSGTLETPIVYTRVADFVPWIQSKLTNQCMFPPKNASKNVYLEKLPTAKKTVENSACDYGN